MDKTVIYRVNIKDAPIESKKSKYKLVHWKPKLFGGFRVKRFPFKYNIFWFYQFLGVFKNKNYSSILLYDGETVVSALLIIPAYYRWTFMKKNDVQLTYVITHPNYRGQGLAKTIIQKSFDYLRTKNIEDVWYVTSSSNTPSMKLCEIMGFEFVGNGEKEIFLNGLVKQLSLESQLQD